MMGVRVRMAVNLNEVSKLYGSQDHPIYALNKVNLTIKQGDWLTILGPSGSGKTTLLNCIGGMVTPDIGEISNGSQNLSNLSAKELQIYRRTKIGYVFQDFRLLEQYSVLDNVMLPQIPYQPLKEIKERAITVLKQLGMYDRMHHIPGQLSGGEKQRTAIARALLNQPSLLICDEPTGNLDKDSRNLILDILNRLHSEGHTILLVTHDPEIADHGDRECYIRDGILEEAEMFS